MQSTSISLRIERAIKNRSLSRKLRWLGVLLITAS
jgi:hypothetical protein